MKRYERVAELHTLKSRLIDIQCRMQDANGLLEELMKEIQDMIVLEAQAMQVEDEA